MICVHQQKVANYMHIRCNSDPFALLENDGVIFPPLQSKSRTKISSINLGQKWDIADAFLKSRGSIGKIMQADMNFHPFYLQIPV